MLSDATTSEYILLQKMDMGVRVVVEYKWSDTRTPTVRNEIERDGDMDAGASHKKKQEPKRERKRE